MKEREKLELILKLIGEYNLPLSPILDYAIKEKIEEISESDAIEIAGGVIDDADNPDEVDDIFIPKSNDIRWFCIYVLSTIEDKLEEREYQILYDALNGIPRNTIAAKWGLTQERIRQIVFKTTKQSKDVLAAQRNNLEETKNENAKLRVQVNLLKEEIERFKEMLPAEVTFQGNDNEIDTKILNLLEVPIEDIKISVRGFNTLRAMGIHKFSDIPQIESFNTLLEVRNSGRKTAHDILGMLFDFHLSFGMSLSEIVAVLKDNNWYTARNRWIKGHVSEESSSILKKKDVFTSVIDKNNTPIENSLNITQEKENKRIDSLNQELLTYTVGQEYKHIEDNIDNFEDLEIEYVKLDQKGNVISTSSSPANVPIRDNSTSKNKEMGWTAKQEKSLTYFFKQGKKYETLAKLFGRTEEDIKARLEKLGLIKYSYKPEKELNLSPYADETASSPISALLKEQTIKKAIDVRKIKSVFDTQVSSYNYFWFIAIISLAKERKELSLAYEKLLIRMAVLAWPIVLESEIDLGEKDMLSKYLYDVQRKTRTIKAASRRIIETSLSQYYNTMGIKDILSPLLKNVPYRFLSPWVKFTTFEEVINKSKQDGFDGPYALYPDRIVLNPQWWEYIENHYNELYDFTFRSFLDYAKQYNSNLKLLKLMSKGKF